MPQVIKSVRWLLMLAIGVSVYALIKFALFIGLYVGALRVRCEAMDAHAGYYDILGDGQWHWGKP